MIYIEQSELIHKNSDVLYPVKITRKSSGKTAFHLVPFGLTRLLPSKGGTCSRSNSAGD
ncbi:hypothetical protein ACNKHV_20295 [Shigella flexneri]